MDPQLQKDLRKIESELSHIRQQSNGGWKKTVWTGILYGAGWLVGTILAAFLIGWILSILGIVPGLGDIVENVQATVEQRSRF